jgi:MFS family permease
LEAPVEEAGLWRVILAASVGTLFEWYDFYLYGSLAVFFGGLFFPAGNETAQLLASLATFGAGFGVRPLGAVVFGHVGDRIGRKYTFLVTMATMGLATALTGLLPTHASAGLFATVALVVLRLLQGLALGGEYGGAATYVAEHVPDARRGFYTSFIQTTATLGFFLSMGVIGTTRIVYGEADFKAFGWRIPFLLSFVLLGVSLYIRLKMRESPLFAKLKASGKTSVNPLKESFTNPENLRYVLIALFGATAGQGVVWYTGQFYALTFLQTSLKLDWQTSYVLVSVALAVTTPLFVVSSAGSPTGLAARRSCSRAAPWPGSRICPSTWRMKRLLESRTTCLSRHPRSRRAHLRGTHGAVCCALQMVYVTMVYGPIAAFLVELFPTSIRYTSMSPAVPPGQRLVRGLPAADRDRGHDERVDVRETLGAQRDLRRAARTRSSCA